MSKLYEFVIKKDNHSEGELEPFTDYFVAKGNEYSCSSRKSVNEEVLLKVANLAEISIEDGFKAPFIITIKENSGKR